MPAATLPVNSNQIQVELDRQLQEYPSTADTVHGLWYVEVSRICPHCWNGNYKNTWRYLESVLTVGPAITRVSVKSVKVSRESDLRSVPYNRPLGVSSFVKNVKSLSENQHNS